MFVVGFYDDRLQLSPIAKLVASLAIGAFLVFALAGAEPAGALPWSYTLLGTVWFAGMCHALNLLDNMDGLATGVAVIATAFLAALLAPSLGSMLVLLLVALAGALVGFLYWNRPRARLFMGDCGSLFIGAVLAGASLVPIFNARVAFVSPAVLVVLILVVPLFDTAFVLVLRRLAGRKASKGGTDHVSHRLVSLGFSERSAVRILYLFGLVGGMTAWGLQKFSAVEPMLPFVALFGVIVILIGVYLARVPAYNAQDFVALQKSSFAPFLKDLAFRWHAGQVLLDLVLITVCYYGAYRLRFDGESLDPFLLYFTATLPVVLGGQARGAPRLGPLSAIVGDLRPARSHDGRPRRGHRIAADGGGVVLPLSRRGLVARRVRPRRAAAERGHHRHARVVPDDEPGGVVEEQEEPARPRLRRRRVRPSAGPRDARQFGAGA